MKKTIIYATDYSIKSVSALKYAHFLSKNLRAKLLIIHVFDYPTFIDTSFIEHLPSLEVTIYDKHRARLKEFVSKYLGNEYNDKNITLKAIESDSIVDTIISEANIEDASLIITGTRGDSLLKELVFGNTAKQLIEKAPCPVLTIPEDATDVCLKTFVYATDFQEEDIVAIEKLIEIIQPFNGLIKVIHITNDKEYDGKVQMEWFKDLLAQKVYYKYIEYEVLYSENIFDTLRVYSGNIGADLIVMMERNRRGLFEKMIHPDLVLQMESYGKIPLMSFNKNTYQFINL